MIESPYHSNAYTGREKKFLIGPIIMLTIVAATFLYVYSTIPSRKYELHDAGHSAAAHGAAHSEGHGASHGEAKH